MLDSFTNPNACTKIGNSGAQSNQSIVRIPGKHFHMSSNDQPQHQMRLYDATAHRLYINAVERERFLVAARSAHRDICSFGLTLLYTGCRISEALALKRDDIQLETRVISFRTLKRRRSDIYREVPIPEELVQALALTMDDKLRGEAIWQFDRAPVNRSTAYRWIKFLMEKAAIHGGQASPKGLRHGYGIHALQCGVPLNMLQKWMGHADMATTAIYADACGVEEREIARRMW